MHNYWTLILAYKYSYQCWKATFHTTAKYNTSMEMWISNSFVPKTQNLQGISNIMCRSNKLQMSVHNIFFSYNLLSLWSESWKFKWSEIFVTTYWSWILKICYLSSAARCVMISISSVQHVYRNSCSTSLITYKLCLASSHQLTINLHINKQLTLSNYWRNLVIISHYSKIINFLHYYSQHFSCI